jgi:ABC-type microcin C transport system duplicated ATPase subunit YejF
VSAALLEIEGLVYDYPSRARLFGRGAERVRALDGASFAVGHGETLALVGESGSGKSTLGRILVGLLRPAAGSLRFSREPGAAPLELTRLSAGGWRAVRRELGLVFQDPFQSLNPRLTVGEAVAEPLRVHGLARRPMAELRAHELLARVGLDPSAAGRFPHEFSGGERQRIALARALVLGPRLLVLDEAVSALDVSVRAQILELLLGLQRERGLAYLFVTHDLALARTLARRVVVLEAGRVVEEGVLADVLDRPRHAATQRLVGALLSGNPRVRRASSGHA